MTRSSARLAWHWFGFIAPVLLLSGMAYANRAPPVRPPNAPVPQGPFIKIEQAPGLERATLVVPKRLLPAGDAAKERADAGISPTSTVIAGVAMSAAVGLLGLQLIRRRAGRPTTLLLVGGIGMAVLSAAALADIAIPGQQRRPRPLPPEPPIELPAGVPVTVQVVDEGDAIVLRIAPEHLREKPATPPGPGGAAPDAPPPSGAAPGGSPPGDAAPGATPPGR